MMDKYKKYIVNGRIEPMQNVPFHAEAPFLRFLMLDEKSICDDVVGNGSGGATGSGVASFDGATGGVKAHIAIHQIGDLSAEIPKYSEPHKHDVDEINLIISESGQLEYRIQFEDEVYEVVSPATIYIPAGVRHSAEVISGRGIFVCIVLKAKYGAS